MPGPKMGARPADFDEATLRQAPSFVKWLALPPNGKLRYACREFCKANPQDEERLLRRIMIARRNNLKDHATLKLARQQKSPAPAAAEAPPQKKRRASTELTDAQIQEEMDVAAVEATRSYKKWATLPDGAEFSYNQKYIKGKDGNDWLLRKNIWRRMRYRRENKRLIQSLKGSSSTETQKDAAGIVDHALLSANAASEVHKHVVDAAVAAAEQFNKATNMNQDEGVVHNPLEANVSLALDAAAKLAAVAAPPLETEPTTTEEESAATAAALAVEQESAAVAAAAALATEDAALATEEATADEEVEATSEVVLPETEEGEDATKVEEPTTEQKEENEEGDAEMAIV